MSAELLRKIKQLVNGLCGEIALVTSFTAFIIVVYMMPSWWILILLK